MTSPSITTLESSPLATLIFKRSRPVALLVDEPRDTLIVEIPLKLPEPQRLSVLEMRKTWGRREYVKLLSEKLREILLGVRCRLKLPDPLWLERLMNNIVDEGVAGV